MIVQVIISSNLNSPDAGQPIYRAYYTTSLKSEKEKKLHETCFLAGYQDE